MPIWLIKSWTSAHRARTLQTEHLAGLIQSYTTAATHCVLFILLLLLFYLQNFFAIIIIDTHYCEHQIKFYGFCSVFYAITIFSLMCVSVGCGLYVFHISSFPFRFTFVYELLYCWCFCYVVKIQIKYFNTKLINRLNKKPVTGFIRR